MVKLLDQRNLKLTRSRPRHSNGLAQTLRTPPSCAKRFGYEPIAQPHAGACNALCRDARKPFLNFHRPCLLASDKPGPSKPGPSQRICRPKEVMRPLDERLSVPNAYAFLRQHITLK